MGGFGPRTSARGVAGSVLAALLLASATVFWLRSEPEAEREGGVVAAQAVATALEAHPPPELTMTDEIRHFRTRLASRGEERFSRRRLVSARLLRFRAYGDRADLMAAEKHLREAMEGAPASPSLLSAKSSLHLLRHEFPDAVETAREANRVYGDFDSDLRLRLFDALWASGERNEAVKLLQLPHDRGSFDYMVRKVRVLDRRGQVERARDLMERALERARAYAEPAAVEAWALVELGHFEHHGGDPRRAVDRYLEALEVLPGNPAAVEGLGRIAYGVDRDMRAAVELFRRALELGGHLDIYPAMADAAEALGQEERARKIRDRFVELATRDAAAERAHRRPLALVLAGRPGRRDRALRYARDDLAGRQTSGSWDTLAWVLRGMGRTGEACLAAEHSTAWGSPEPTVLHHAGVIALECGDAERGIGLLEDALKGRTELSPATVRQIERRLDRAG